MNTQDMLIAEIRSTINPLRSLALKRGYRLPTIIYGDPALLNALGESTKHEQGHSLFITGDNTLKANDIIGHEYDLIAFHLDESFDPNFLAAISGTLKAGGVLILLCPQAHKNKIEQSPFYHYVLTAINNDKQFLTIKIANNKLDITFPTHLNEENNLTHSTLKNTRYAQQENTIALIKNVVNGHRKRPLTITANRGRGKSAAVGIAIGQLITYCNNRPMNIFITAPSLAASTVIFKHIQRALPNDNRKTSSAKILYQNNTVSFISPDKLIKDLPSADLLVVDEAAGFNLFTLESLLKYYSRIVFATTLHGYEGSGQGFITRFSKTLDSHTPDWKTITLHQPIRWEQGDALEAFVDNVFMLNNGSTSRNENVNSEASTRIISHKELINQNDNSLLKSLFFLLKSAHYKTSPNDLRQLMDSENAIIFTRFHNKSLIAAAIIEKEGNLPEDLIDDIYKGNRRPKGELIPQSIVMHLGLKEAARLSYFRIMRIAVHPDVQGRKHGSALLSSINTYAEKNDIDFIGCSFGATCQLLRFWYAHDYVTFRIGYKKNSFSGCNAALLAKPISTPANAITITAKEAFIDNFIEQLSASLNTLDPVLVAIILRNSSNKHSVKITKKILEDVNSFANHNRSYDDNLASIKAYLLHSLQHSGEFSRLTGTPFSLVILKVFQHKSWAEVSKRMGYTGKNQALTEFKICLSKMLAAPV